MSRILDCVSVFCDGAPIDGLQKQTTLAHNCERRLNRCLHSDLSKQETTKKLLRRYNSRSNQYNSRRTPGGANQSDEQRLKPKCASNLDLSLNGDPRSHL